MQEGKKTEGVSKSLTSSNERSRMARIFIIEDNAMIGRLWKLQLEKAGHEVFIAITGTEALDTIGKANPDIILADVMLPGMSGFEVIEKLNERETTKDIPVIMLSATSSHQNKERAHLLGVYKYIVKSECSPRQLLETIEAALGARS